MNWESLGAVIFGFVVCASFVFVFGFSNLEVPSTISGFDVRDLGFGSMERDSAPGDHLSEEDIVVLRDRVCLKVDGASLSNYADSGSMLPILDKGANGVRIVPESENDVEVGDIISFRRGGLLIVHRVVEKGVDDDGVYFVMKGDANLVGDGKIRFGDIEYVTIGIIY